jgi:hypothetical protein
MEQPQEDPKPRIVETKKSQLKTPTKVEFTKEELLKRLKK